ncbi:2Fe-2S iron-sulfur cluster-binding protein [Zhongshania aquimaris]|uniref:2Fe-2S iron-sulfur cluster binding domain-containing protein n=1 Tax=Zhongshania aquimaris TaxID=2857107 RepID=A0ABS6VUK0_9GAMM|nr:2Fe-2S iron-sulfur cluster-binding protein [Zhongshania aquimaris]MBW2942006.1 2Fe-2S iron-sulfur cluster binding domain-containing protein [Zhongshania aquimaris]
MGSITFIEHDGTQHTVDLEPGKSLMQIALDNDVPGIDADCGGECACGTCHVIIESHCPSIIGGATGDELQMLDLTPERSDTSRLACQIITTDAMDGLVARLPEFQM